MCTFYISNTIFSIYEKLYISISPSITTYNCNDKFYKDNELVGKHYYAQIGPIQLNTYLCILYKVRQYCILSVREFLTFSFAYTVKDVIMNNCHGVNIPLVFIAKIFLLLLRLNFIILKIANYYYEIRMGAIQKQLANCGSPFCFRQH